MGTDSPTLVNDLDLFRLGLEQIDDRGFLLVDLHGQIVSWNIGATHLTGLSSDETVGRPLANLFAKSDQLTLLSYFANASRAASLPRRLTLTLLREPGQACSVEARLTPLRQGGTIVAFSAEIAPMATSALHSSSVNAATEQLVKVLQAHVKDVFFVLRLEGDRTYRFVDVNNAFLAVTGLTLDQVVNRLVNEVIPEPSLKLVLSKYEEAATRGCSVSWEEVTTFPSGVRSGEVTVTPVISAAGICTHLLGTVHDVTNARLDAERLRRGEDRLLAAQRMAKLGVWDADLKTQEVWWSDELYRLFGQTPETFHPTNANTIAQVPDEDQPVVRQAIQSLFMGAASCRFQHRVHRPDGATIWLDVEGRLERDGDGQPARMWGVSQDITEQRTAESDLRQSETRYRLLVQHARVVIWEANPETFDFTYVSEYCEELTGYPPAAWLEPGFWASHIHPEDAEHAINYCLSATREGQDHQFEYRLQHARGGYVWVEDVVKVVVENGRVVAVRGALIDRTARKAAEQALRESEARLRRLGDSLPGGAVYVLQRTSSGERNFLYVSQGLERILGVTPEEAMRDSNAVYGLIPADDVERMAAAECASMTNLTPFDCEFRERTRGGELRWLHCRSFPRRLVDGSTIWDGVVLDITERKRAEQRVREALNIFNAGRAVLVRWQKAFPYRMEAVTESIRQFGYSPEEFTSGQLNWIDIIFPDDFDRTHEELIDALGNQRSHLEQRYKIRTKSGEIRWIYDFTVPVFDSEGQVTHADGYLLDITDHWKAEEALRQREQRLEVALSAGGMGTWDWDIATGEILWSDTHFTLLGYPERFAPVNYEFFVARVHPDDLSAVEHAIASARESQARYHHEFRVIWPDGSLRWLAGFGRFTYDRAGHATRMYGVLTDITDRRRAAEELAQRQSELRHAARLQTMGQLVATYSHEVTQPLAAISNFASASLRLLEDPTELPTGLLGEFVTMIDQQSRRAGDILQRFRAFSRRSPAKPEVCDVNDLLRQSVALLQYELGRCGAELQWELCAAPAAVFGDKIQLEQVFVNLLLNARDAVAELPTARRRLTVRTRAAVADIVIEIEDQGEGVAPALLGRLFEPFVSLKPDGMGIGLSICRSIVEEHGGQISGGNNQTRGATFQVRLPSMIQTHLPENSV